MKITLTIQITTTDERCISQVDEVISAIRSGKLQRDLKGDFKDTKIIATLIKGE